MDSNQVRQHIAYADQLAQTDINAAYEYYKKVAEWVQQAGDNALLQEIYDKMRALGSAGQAVQAQGSVDLSRESKYNVSAAQHYVQQQATDSNARPTNVTPPPRQAGGWTPLVFSHGQELEVQLVKSDGTFMSGDEMVHLMEELVKEARSLFVKWMDGGQVPQYIMQKMGGYPEFYTDHEKGLVMQIPYYLPDGKQLKIDSFGRDGNVAAITYILELVTPVCTFVEELAWWESTLFSLAYQVLQSQKGDLYICSTGLNPMGEYMRGLSFGDHSHIGTFYSPLEKIQFYDMIRNFIPAAISLSVNSPLTKGKPTDEVKVVKGRYAAPNCVRSIRLLNNTSMLSSNNPARYPPYLLEDNEQTRQQFLTTVGKADFYDARFQDVYPYTDFGTIEVRIADAQLSVARRIALCCLFQVLGYKTRKILSQGRYVPGAASECLVKNREKAVRQGLFGTFTTEGIDEAQFRQYDPEFANVYLGDAGGERVRYIFQHVERMFKWLAPEIKELGYTQFMMPLLLSVFGELPNGILTPFTEADYQLSMYYYKQVNNMSTNIMPDLINLTKQYSMNSQAHALQGGRPNLPPELL